MLGAERLKKLSLPFKKSAVEFDVLQSCVVNIRPQQIHHEVKCMPNDEQNNPQHYQKHVAARKKV